MNTWRRNFICLFAAFCGVGIAIAGPFLDGLASRTEKVGSSPFATGGDVILCLSQEKGDYVHVFTNTAETATFVPLQALSVQVLAVGGGGGGGCGFTVHGGGGGAGGLVDAWLQLEQGAEQSVKIGGGGASKTGNDYQRGGSGVNTQFGSLTAFGGGGGGGFATNSKGNSEIDGLSGGSGGGGGGSQVAGGTGGAAMSGQGHAGGLGAARTANTNGASGGGGGAGAPGEDSNLALVASGRGGDGVVREILGVEQAFAGGGGGGSFSANQATGGLGGGGDGNSSSVNSTSGEDGLGGGGGGAACNGNGKRSGQGGSGIVIVRYRARQAPEIVCSTAEAVLNADYSVRVSVPFMMMDNAPGLVVSGQLEYWPTADESSKETVEITGVAATNFMMNALSFVIEGLPCSTAYSYAATLTTAGGASDSAEGTFTTLATSCGGVVSGIDVGDYIHKAAFDGSDEIFIFTNTTKSAVFTPQADGFVRLLLVGGGAAGYDMGESGGVVKGGGGGGAGGLIYDSAYFVRAGQEYAIAVGAGSKSPGGTWNKALNGGNSSFGSMVAFGGGAGGGESRQGSSGGSGGGGGASAQCGFAQDAKQGHRGGVEGLGGSGKGGGGGGGAGSVGGEPTDMQGGSGGAGLAYDITGELVTYAGGGGAGASGTCSAGLGGAGGGGAGCTATTLAQAGVDGLGGGGGGGNKGKGAGTSNAGRGGNGIVVVRYTDMSKLGADPKFSAMFSNEREQSVDVHVEVSYCGAGSSSVALWAVWGYTADDLAFTNKLADAFAGAGDFTVQGLSPARGYVMRIVATNAKGGQADGMDYEFTTSSSMGVSATISYSGFSYSFGYTVSALGQGENVLELCAGDQGEEEVLASQEIFEAGAGVLDYTFPPEESGRKFYYYLRLRNTEGNREWTQQTALSSFVLSDNTVYTFGAAGGVGAWTDPASWSPNQSGGLGYPSVGATAVFSSDVRSEVSLDRAIQVKLFTLKDVKGATVVFRGLSDDASLVSATSGGDTFIGAGTTCIVDHARIDFNTGNAWPRFAANQALVLRNGATFAYSGGVHMDFGANDLLSVESDSTFSTTELRCTSSSRIRVDDATIALGGALKPLADTRLEIAGESPSFQCSTSTGLTIYFDPPEQPTAWTQAPVRLTGAFATGSAVCTVRLPTRRESKLSRTARRCDIPLIYAAGGITTNNVVFGTHPMSKGGFAYSQDLKTLYYRYVPATGMVMLIR